MHACAGRCRRKSILLPELLISPHQPPAPHSQHIQLPFHAAATFVAQVAKWASPRWAPPLAAQECLLHFAANHELHAGLAAAAAGQAAAGGGAAVGAGEGGDAALSPAALRLLQRITALHPPARFVEGDGGEATAAAGAHACVQCLRARHNTLRLITNQHVNTHKSNPQRNTDLPPRLEVGEELWHPLVRDSTLTRRLGAAGFQLLQRLIGCALEAATGAPPPPDSLAGGAGLAASDSRAELRTPRLMEPGRRDSNGARRSESLSVA